jgi:hypothetical protein
MVVVLGMVGCSSRAKIVAPGADELAPDRMAEVKDPGQAAGDGFAFPKDAAGVVLLRLLKPADVGGQPEKATRPKPWKSPKSPELSMGPLPPTPAQGLVPALSGQGKGMPPQPHLVSPEDLGMPEERVQLPVEPVLAATERARADSIDVHQPAALPMLARAVPDRASLEDPTADASNAAALAATLPQRLMPAPFLRLTVPEPYENRRPLTLPVPPESAEPITATPQPPRP